MNIAELISNSHETALRKGWWNDGERNFGELVALAHSELSEVLEEKRAGRSLTEIYYETNGKPCGVAVEFADLFIRVADICGKYNIPLEEALEIKMIYNETRPYKHGKTF